MPRLPRRPLLLHRHGPHRGRVRRGRLPQAPARRARSGPPASSRGDCKATINANYKGTKLISAGPTATGLATSGESHGLTIADNGWVSTSAAATAAPTPSAAPCSGLPALGRILDHANPNVGIGCGTVHIYDPAQSNGAREQRRHAAPARSPSTATAARAASAPTEADHKMEYGLLGIAPRPGLLAERHIYLQYFPTFNPRARRLRAWASIAASRRCRARASRASRSTCATKKLDLSSEMRIFEYDAQIYSCCHVGGGMGFDSEGNLYVTTGDTNSSQGSNGYSGNNPIAKCPIGPADRPRRARTAARELLLPGRAPDRGQHQRLQRQDAAVQADGDIPDGAAADGRRRDDLHAPGRRRRPTARTCSRATEGGGGKTRPEIYAMGLRNPSRLSIDPKTDIPYTAWVGPDAGAPSAHARARRRTRTPPRSRTPATMAGRTAWATSSPTATASTTARCAPTARPATCPAAPPPAAPRAGTTATTCATTRRTTPASSCFPHTTGTGADAGKVRGNNLWYSRGNPGGNNGCPDFPRPRGARAPRPTTAPRRRQLCPYAQDNGMTIMDGPVYRYDASADNSKRWPEYWDGRWFLHNNGGPSIKHGLLLDPATAGTGGLPIYADSLRDTLTWARASYMDSKFGPDGALYVQTYDGFFRAGPNVSIYRYDYVGGAADAECGAARRRRSVTYQVRFSVGQLRRRLLQVGVR